MSRKEKPCIANAAASNGKRKLSAIDEIQRKAMGRRMDAIYAGGGIEPGCMEIGTAADLTKELKDGKMKMPVVLKDMLLQIVEAVPTLLHQPNVTGYVINGKRKQRWQLYHIF